MPQQLMELMRHEDISTTMKYYVSRNAEEDNLTGFKAKYLKHFANVSAEIEKGVSSFIKEVKDGSFPAKENEY